MPANNSIGHDDATTRHLTTAEVANRLRVHPRTVERWRRTGQGPEFLKLAGRVIYRLQDVLAFELAQLRISTARP